MNFFRRARNKLPPSRLPTGCFSVDRAGNILASTLPHNFPACNLHAIAEVVLSVFRSAPQHGVPLSELNLRYETLTITAHELRGGAMVFLKPRENLQF
jgi:hypothetical protein